MLKSLRRSGEYLCPIIYFPPLSSPPLFASTPRIVAKCLGEENSVTVKKHIFPGLPHAFRRYADLPSSTRWDSVTFGALRWILDDDAPGDQTEAWNVEVPDEYREISSEYFD
jgi:hypothetical protein